MIRGFILFVALLVAAPAAAQTFPELSGRVVDQAELLSPEQEAALTARLEALETASSRQLVVATVRSLEDHPIEDYGYRLGRHWGIGQREANNGIILLVAPNERKVRIEVGYGLEPIMTDALSHQIIEDRILPRFRDNGDYAGGINDGATAIIEQLQAPPEQAEQRALAAAEAAKSGSGGASFLPLIFWAVVLGFMFIPMLINRLRGKKYRGKRRRSGPVLIWGPGLGSSGWGGGSSSSWGGGGSSWGGGGGGFSGGGGSFGGGGASGGW